MAPLKYTSPLDINLPKDYIFQVDAYDKSHLNNLTWLYTLMYLSVSKVGV